LKLLIILLLSLIAAFAISCVLTISVNPEVTFWNEAISRRLDDITQIRENHPEQPLIIFTGGSSCAFSIDPAIVEEAIDQPAINLGLPVACGARYILHQALRHAKDGDLIIIGTEPDLLTFPDQETSPSKISFALEARRGNFTDAAGGSTFGESLTLPQYLTLSRPGSNYLITLAGRLCMQKGYRYKSPDIRYRGLIQTPIRNKSMNPVGARAVVTLHPQGLQLLKTFTAAADQKGVRVAYSMPWSYTASSSLSLSRANNRKLLSEISKIMPIIDDGYSGAMDNIENYADGSRHLSEKGSKLRSEALAQSLKQYLNKN